MRITSQSIHFPSYVWPTSWENAEGMASLFKLPKINTSCNMRFSPCCWQQIHPQFGFYFLLQRVGKLNLQHVKVMGLLDIPKSKKIPWKFKHWLSLRQISKNGAFPDHISTENNQMRMSAKDRALIGGPVLNGPIVTAFSPYVVNAPRASFAAIFL